MMPLDGKDKKRLPASMMMVTLLLLIALAVVPHCHGQGAVDDKFTLKNLVVNQVHRDDLGEEWSSAEPLSRMNVLANDKWISDDVDSCARQPDGITAPDDYLKFTEISQAAGISHQHRLAIPTRPHCSFDFVIPTLNSTRLISLPGQFCTIDYITGGVASGDYDNDGLIDLFFTVAHARSVLYRNNGDGTYTDVTTDTGVGPDMYGNGAGFVDVDQDGDLDLYVTTLGGTRHYLYINYGGHFKEEAVARGVGLEAPNKRKLAGMTPNFGDYDNDGYLDIYTTEWILHNNGKPSVSRLLRNLGATRPGYFEDTTDFAGVNMDNYWPRYTTLNQGTHTFGSSFTDFDKDGYPELLVTADFRQSKMFWNNKNGTFTECTAECGLNVDIDAMGHAIGDFTNDGNLDWFSSAVYEQEKSQCGDHGCTFFGFGSRLFSNNGDRTFNDITTEAGVIDGGWAWGAAFLDFNNDGFLDLVHTNGFDTPGTTIDDKFGRDNMRLFENTGVATQPGNIWHTKEMASQYKMNFYGHGRGLLKADLDNDGDEDVVVATNYGTAKVFRNDGGNKNNWLKVKAANRCLQNVNKLCTSYGATVTVEHTNGRKQFQEIGSSSHFLGQSERVAHFGLGSTNAMVTVTVTWPAMGVSLRVDSVPVNTVVRLVRPLSSTQVTYLQVARCPKITIQSITRQPQSMRVDINPDMQTLSLSIAPGTHLHNIGMKTFDYSIHLDPPTSTSAANFNTTATVTLNMTNENPVDHCQGYNYTMPDATDERRFDGISNNKYYTTWGAPNTQLHRAHHSVYSDGISMPAAGCLLEKVNAGKCPFAMENMGLGSTRPSPRQISNTLLAQNEDIPSARRMNDLTMHFGQFFSHDLDLTTTLPRFAFTSRLNDVWMPISVPKGDIHFDPTHTGTKFLPFLRSVYDRCTGPPNTAAREQVNVVTSFVDASIVYGSSATRNGHLRTFVDGKMKQGDDGILPKNVYELNNANSVGRLPSHLYVAGDTRANVQPGLTAMHSLFVREHNRLCDEYKKYNHTADDETLFQAARRVLIAELQSIAYNEYIPSLLGGKHHIPAYTGYKQHVNPQISHIFGTAAFRFGHSQVNTLLFRLNEEFQDAHYGHALLRDSYFTPEKLADEGGLDPLLRGTMYFPAQEMDTLMVDEMRNVLFSTGQMGGLDLAAMNIQRGRDHGLADYNSVRKLMGLQGVTDFSQITSNTENAQKLKDLYQSVDNIDLWVGGLNEDHEPGSEMGPLFRAILMETLLRIRDGDRFWYEAIMSQEEITKVESMTLAKMIALNTNFTNVPSFSFFSMRDCSDVVDFQCVRKPVTGAAELLKENMALQRANEQIKSHYERVKVDYMAADDDKDEMRSLSIGLGALAGMLLVICLLLLLVVLLRSTSSKDEDKVKAYTLHNPYVGSDKHSTNSSSKNSYAYP